MVEGDYNDGDTITVTAQPLTPAAFDVQSGTVLARVKGYFSCLSRGEMPSMVANAEVLEQWRIELADDVVSQRRLGLTLTEGMPVHLLRNYYREAYELVRHAPREAPVGIMPDAALPGGRVRILAHRQ